MQNTADQAESKLPESERDLLALASRNAADVQGAIESLELFIEGGTRLVSAAEKVSGIFATVASRVGDATFKATFAATEGQPPREIAVALVTELSQLASMSLKASNELRRELRDVTSSVTSALPSLRQARRAVESLSGVLKTLASQPNRTSVQPPVVIELRTVAKSLSADGGRDGSRQLDDPGRETTTIFVQARTRRFPN
jgi:ethanolamine utilization microcompartment shell protein EutL